MIAFRDKASNRGESRMTCCACREFFYELNEENENMKIWLIIRKEKQLLSKSATMVGKRTV